MVKKFIFKEFLGIIHWPLTRGFDIWPLFFYQLIYVFTLTIPTQYQWNGPLKSGVTVENCKFLTIFGDLWPQSWPLTPIAFLSCSSIRVYLSYRVSLLYDNIPWSYSKIHIFWRFQPLTFDLQLWPLTHITLLICWAFTYNHSCRISYVSHISFES